MVWLNALAGHFQTQVIQAHERAQVRTIKDSIGHVEVFQMDGVGISIIERPRPLHNHDTPNVAHNTPTPLNAKSLFTYLDPTWTHQMPAMTNQIESTNARLRQMLHDHRSMRLTRRMKVVFWWCYTHSARPQPAATILATMPTDEALENAWHHASQTHQATGTIPGWGDTICFNELHHTTPYHNTWD